MDSFYEPSSNNFHTNPNHFYANQYHQNAAAMAAFYLNGRSGNTAINSNTSANLLPLRHDYNSHEQAQSFQFQPNYSGITSPNAAQKVAQPYFALTPPLSISSSNFSSTPSSSASSCSSASSINASSASSSGNEYLTRVNPYANPHFQYLQHSPVDQIHAQNQAIPSKTRHQSFATSSPSNFNELTSSSSSSNSSSSSQQQQHTSFESSSDLEIDSSKRTMAKSSPTIDPKEMSFSKSSTAFITPSLMSIEVCQRRKRRQRTQFSKYQLCELEKLFHSTRYPDIYCREDLSARIGIPESRIQVWFKNRRSKIRKDEKVETGDINSHVTSNEDDYADEEASNDEATLKLNNIHQHQQQHHHQLPNHYAFLP